MIYHKHSVPEFLREAFRREQRFPSPAAGRFGKTTLAAACDITLLRRTGLPQGRSVSAAKLFGRAGVRYG